MSKNLARESILVFGHHGREQEEEQHHHERRGFQRMFLKENYESKATTQHP